MTAQTKKIFFIGLLFFIISFLVMPQLVGAQASLGLEVAGDTGLGTTDLKELIVRIIQILLGFLGLIALIVMLYGGYVWLSSGGEADKISFAKKILVNGVIGLVIIFSAFAIVTFIINQISEATVPGEACEPPGAIEACNNLGDCQRQRECQLNNQWGSCYITNLPCDSNFDPSGSFIAQSISPQGNLNIKNVVVQVTFNRHVDPASVINPTDGFPQSLRVLKDLGDGNYEETAGILTLAADRLVTFTPALECPGFPGVFCLEENQLYKIGVSDTEGVALVSLDGQTVNCGFGVCEAEFTTGELVDVTPPEPVNLTQVIGNPSTALYNGVNLSADELYELYAYAEDDGGLSQIDFYLENGYMDTASPTPPPPLSYEGFVYWETNSYQTNQTYVLQARAYDVAGHDAWSDPIEVMIRPSHCFNGQIDPDLGETGLDCGGDCAVCEGELCGELGLGGECVNPDNAACSSNLCDVATCYCVPLPVIFSVDPADGAPGNWVTILGQHFGSEPGQVWFTDPNGHVAEALAPAVAGCAVTWQDNQIIVEVPESASGAGLSGWRVVTRQTLSSNIYENFTLDPNAVYPGVCGLAPDAGLFESEFTVFGTQFGDGLNRSVYFGDQPGENLAANPVWSSFLDHDEVTAEVPNLQPGQAPVRVEVEGGSSNGIYFNVLGEETEALSVSYFEPAAGAPGQYVTIHGSGFGATKTDVRTVRFLTNNGFEEGNFEFPQECGTNYWSDNQIVVKVPFIESGEVILGGAPLVVIKDGQEAVSSDNFIYDESLEVTPGICSLNPNEGPVGTIVEIAGEPFSGAVVDFSNQDNLAPEAGSNNNLIYVTVPAGTVTGNVSVNNNGQSSNAVDFNVATSVEPGSPENAAFYEWQFTTCWDCLVPEVVERGSCVSGNASPSPLKYPWNGYDTIFINQNFGVEFNVDMDNSTFSNVNVILENCGLADVFDQAGCLQINWPWGETTFTDTSPEYVTFDPVNNLAPNTWYQVTLTTNLKGIFINPLNEEIQRIPLAQPYVWRFKTQGADGLCSADQVSIYPPDRTQHSNFGPIPRFQTAAYNSYGINGGNCAICADTFNWDWSTDNADAQLQDQDVLNNSHNWLYGAGLVEQPEVAFVAAQISDVPPFPMTEAPLNIIPPEAHIVMDYSCSNGSNRSPTPWPNEQSVCANAAVYARFNIPMDASTLTTGNVGLYQCDDFGCADLVAEDDDQIVPGGNLTAIEFVYTPADALATDAWFEIRLAGDVLSADGVPLTGMRFWQFRTRADATWCQIDSINVSPGNQTLTVDQTYDYVANGYSGATCQLLLLPAETIWNWSSELNINDVPPFFSTGDNIASVDPDVSLGAYGQTTVTAENPGLSYIRSAIRSGGAYVYNSGTNGQVTVGTPQVLTLENYMPAGDDVCLNALARAEFNLGLDESAINPGNFQVTYDSAGAQINRLLLITHNGSRQAVSLRPASGTYLWTPDIVYTVTVKGGANGISSGDLRLTAEGCPADWDSLAESCNWTFTTVDEMCQVDYVNLSPTSTQNFIGEEQNWEAIGYDEFDLALSNPVNHWSLTNENVAALSPLPPNNADTLSQAAGSAWVEATIETITNGAELTVMPEVSGPSVIETAPENYATDVCLNSLVSLDFDKYLDEQTVNNQTISVSYHSENVPLVDETVLTFDGAGDFVFIDSGAAESLNVGTSDFMAEVWLKTAASAQSPIFEKWGETGWALVLYADGTLHARFREAGGDDVAFTSVRTVNDDAWHHLVLTADRDGLARFYIDGQVDDSSAIISSVGDLSNNEDAGLGAYGPGPTSFNGSLASFRLYKFAVGLPLNISGLIQEQSNEPLGVGGQLQASLIAAWEMNEGNGNQLEDSSQNNNTLSQTDRGYMPAWQTAQLPLSGVCEQIALSDSQSPLSGKTLIFRTLIARFINNFMPDLFGNLFNRFLGRAYAANEVIEIFILPASGYWCPVSGYGDWALSHVAGTAQARFNLTRPLPAEALIRVLVLGGADGLKSLNGLELVNPNNGDNYAYYFGTGEDVCELSFVAVTANAQTGDNRWTFTSSHDNPADNLYEGEDYDQFGDVDKVYQATGYASAPQGSQALSPIPGVYEWDWQWSSKDTGIALTADCSVFEDYYPDCADFANDSSVVLAANNNGETDITAQAVFPPWYNRENLSDAGVAVVELCENPWPSYNQNADLRYYDENNPHTGFKFALHYCRDNGDYGTQDDLPAIYEGADLGQVGSDGWVITSSAGNAYDGPQDDLLKEYLIPVAVSDDIIGLRVYSNYYHLSPADWYKKNIPVAQQGALANLTIDGYPAIQDGRTVYVAGTTINLDGGDNVTQAYTNVFLISYNSGASQTTLDIFNRLAENLEFNTNVQDPYFKDYITNDLERLAGLSTMQESLDQYSLSHQDKIQNNDFEQGLDNWQIENTPVVEVNTDFTGVKRGSKSLHITADAATEGIYQMMLLEPNTNYDMSAWVYVVSGQVQLTFYGNDHGGWYSPLNYTGWIQLHNVLQTIGAALEANGYDNGLYLRSHEGPAEFFVDSIVLRSNYPSLAAGSYLPGMSTSKWPSWNQTLGQAVGTDLPVDPLNNFNGCLACTVNLINPGFESDILSWTAEGGASRIINAEADYIKSGEQSLQILYSNTAGAGVSQPVSLAEDSLYNLSAWIYVVSGQAQLKYGDNVSVATPADQTGWYQLQTEIDTNDESPDQAISVLTYSTATGNEFYIDDVSLVPQDAACGYDPNTCWNPSANNEQGAFACDAASYFYRYQYQLDQDGPLTNGVPTYFLSAKMEMPYAGGGVAEVWQPQNNSGYVFLNTDHLILSPDQVAGCDQTVIGQACGNGVVEPPTEECEPGQHHNWCPLGYDWANPQILGCQDNCQWFEPVGEYPAYCGGYCGNGLVDAGEGCDTSAPIGAQGFGLGNNLNNQYDCSLACEDLGGYCGNGTVDINYGEECDGANGLGAWDCASGNPACRPADHNEQCRVYCTGGGAPYTGSCGNGTIEPGEECDGANRPPNTVCSNSCQVTGCEDGFSACDLFNDDDDGCEVQISSDPENCSACGNDCRAEFDPLYSDYTIVSCVSGSCGYACDPYSDYLNCENPPADCETNYLNDANNCGFCGNSCLSPLQFIANTSFETGYLSPWQLTVNPAPPAAYEIVSQHVHDGSYSVHITATGGSQGIWQDVSYEPLTTYDLSVWVYVVSGRAALTFWGTDRLPQSDWVSPAGQTGWFKLENRLATSNSAGGANGYNSAEIFVYSFDGAAEFYVDEVIHSGPAQTGTACNVGSCAYSCLQPPWADCDGDSACESNLNTSVTDCGECGLACPEPDQLNTQANRDLVEGYNLNTSLPADYGTAICGDAACSMDWHCTRDLINGEADWGYLDHFVIEDNDFDNWPVTLHAGESTSVTLPSCKLSGNLLVDMAIDNVGGASTGIVFVSDRSGSMGSGPSSTMQMLKTAIAGTGNALDTLFDTNPSAQVALISYGDIVSLDSDFRGLDEKSELKDFVNAYSNTLGNTWHDQAFGSITSDLDWGGVQNKIVIFMTDGNFSNDHEALDEADALRNNGFDIFTVALTNDNLLIAYMNGLSSKAEQVPSNCTCGGNICRDATNGTCGDGVTQCATVNYAQFEDCDGQSGCGIDCEWQNENDVFNRAYATLNAAQLNSMYQAIAGAIPVDEVALKYNDISQGIVTPVNNLVTDFIIDLQENPSGNTNTVCQQGANNTGTIEINFSGGPDAQIILSNPRYYYCPWSHWPFVGNSNFEPLTTPAD